MKSIRKYLIKNDLYDNLNLSSQLLEHSSLLTPILQKNFGDMTVDKCQLFQCMESPDTYLRESKLRQKCSGNTIVDAKL